MSLLPLVLCPRILIIGSHACWLGAMIFLTRVALVCYLRASLNEFSSLFPLNKIYYEDHLAKAIGLPSWGLDAIYCTFCAVVLGMFGYWLANVTNKLIEARNNSLVMGLTTEVTTPNQLDKKQEDGGK